MPAGILLAASTPASGTGAAYNDCRQVFTMTDGRLLAIYGTDGGTGGIAYRTSADGITWSGAIVVPLTAPPLGKTYHITACVQHGDTLYLFMVDAPAGFVLTNNTLNVLAYAAGALTGTIYAESEGGYDLSIQNGACYDATAGRIHNAEAAGSVVSIEAFNPASPGTGEAGDATLYRGTAPAVVGMAAYPGGGGASTVLTLLLDASHLYVVAASYSGGSYTVAVPENVTGATVSAGACSLDATNTLDIVYLQGSSLYASRRTGSGIYSSPVNIASGVGSTELSLAADGADLVVLYQSVANYGSGELYCVWRTTGTWALPKLFAGGDAGGYGSPKAQSSLDAGKLPAIYKASGGVYFTSISRGAAPDAPTVIAPSGTIDSPTPDITGEVTNTAAPNDPAGGVEIEVTRVSDAHVMWDSGKMTETPGYGVPVTFGTYGLGSNTGDSNYVAPTALSYGIAYAVITRAWDSVSLPVLASAWSSPVTFTPQRAGTVDITDAVCSGTDIPSSPGTLAAPQLDTTTASWAQADSQDASHARRILYEIDGVTPVQIEPWTLIPGGVAAGGSAVLGLWLLSGLGNDTDYLLVVEMRDAVTEGVAASDPWTLHTSWTPPSPPTSLTATPNPGAGTIDLAWINGAGATSVTTQRAPTGTGTGTWTTVSSGSLITAFSDDAPMGVAFDYRVFSVSALGVESTPATVSHVEIGPNGLFGVCISDVLVPSIKCWLGVLDQWEDATGWDQPDDVLKYVPLGSSTPIVSFRLQDYHKADNRQFLIPTVGVDANGEVITQAETVAILRALRKSRHPLRWRDIDGNNFVVAIDSPTVAFANNAWPLKRVKFNITEITAP